MTPRAMDLYTRSRRLHLWRNDSVKGRWRSVVGGESGGLGLRGEGLQIRPCSERRGALEAVGLARVGLDGEFKGRSCFAGPK